MRKSLPLKKINASSVILPFANTIKGTLHGRLWSLDCPDAKFHQHIYHQHLLSFNTNGNDIWSVLAKYYETSTFFFLVLLRENIQYRPKAPWVALKCVCVCVCVCVYLCVYLSFFETKCFSEIRNGWIIHLMCWK